MLTFFHFISLRIVCFATSNYYTQLKKKYKHISCTKKPTEFECDILNELQSCKKSQLLNVVK